MYDFIIVGAGFFGSICAYELNKIGKKVLVIDKKDHIGGNCYSDNKNNINIHKYGPHIFHTSDKEVWDWINNFTDFNGFVLQTVANYKNELYSLPFNMWSFYQMWGINNPSEVKKIIKEQSSVIKNKPQNLEEQAISLVGTDIYEKLIKGYTEKQWRRESKNLPPDIIKRLPVRFTFNNNYFNDTYQGIPIGGYTKIFEKILNGIELKLNVDYLKDKDYYDSISKRIIYTGPIDRFFEYKYGVLEYKTLKFEHKLYNIENYQGNPIINYTDSDVPYTRVVEHKHFEDSISDETWVTYEYPVEYIPKVSEPYYPVNDKINNEIYNKYKEESKNTENIIFGGRLAEYKYYDMDDVIKSALETVKNIK